jgi:hypothetical protein
VGYEIAHTLRILLGAIIPRKISEKRNDRSSISFIIYYTCLAWYSFFAVLLCDLMVEKGFFCQGAAKTSPSELVRALI